MPPKAKANLNSPSNSPKKTPTSGIASGSGASASPATGSPLRPSSSDSSAKSTKASKPPQPLIVRPAATSSHKTLLKIYAHLDTYKLFGITSGDLVLISKPGDRGIVVIATPAPPNTAQDVVQLNPLVRKLLGVVLGDRVNLVKYTTRPEYAVKVQVGTKASNPDDLYLDKVSKVLHEIGIIMPGIQFTINNNLDSKASEYTNNNSNDDVNINLDFVVVDAGQVPDLSNLSIENEDDFGDIYAEPSELLSPVYYFDKKKSTIEFTSNLRVNADLPVPTSYSSIGGLGKQIALLKSKIELPLHRPSLFQRFSMAPDRGFLLHGPPGTGKTMLLRAVAQETNAHVLTINGPSIVSKYLGETESALRNIFAEARKYQPAIIFIDEIDALVPKRDSDESGEAESRVVSTLLTLMDGMGIGGKVVVIGATNRPNSIDPALRRPGRFGQELEIGIPDVEGRLDILKLQLSNMPHSLSDEVIQELAAKTHGYVGADITALCRDSVMSAIQRGLAENTPESEMEVSALDMERALLDIRPSAMREIFLETPKVYWTDIGGQEEVKQKLKETIEWPLSHPEAFKKLGVHPPKGILLYGPPGCSKTLTAKALATEAGLNFLAVKGPELFNKFVGESERAVREIFSKARAAAPSIIFFDEIDALSSTRGEGEAGGDRVLTSLLNEMDGIEALVGVTILAATNRPEVIDPALMRPGRLDRLIYVSPPNTEARFKILEIQFKKMSIGSDVDINEIASITEGCSGAEVVSLCQEAGLLAMNENITIDSIMQRHFMTALSKLKRGITQEMIDYYKSFSKEGIIG